MAKIRRIQNFCRALLVILLNCQLFYFVTQFFVLSAPPGPTWLQEDPADLPELREEHRGLADVVAGRDAREVHDAGLPPLPPPLHSLPSLKRYQVAGDKFSFTRDDNS